MSKYWKYWRCAGALTILLLMACSWAPIYSGMVSDGGGDATSSRGEYRRFAPQEAELRFSGGVYTNSTLTIPIPSNATVLQASMNITGYPVTGALELVDCSFNQSGVCHKAYKCAVAIPDRPTTSPRPSQLMFNEFTSAEYTAVSQSDNTYARQAGDNSPSGTEDGFHLFRFKVPIDISAEVTVQWEGHASDFWGNAWHYNVYIWFEATGTWQSVGGGQSATDVLVTNTFNGPGYIADRWVQILATCYDGNEIRTDFVSIFVKGYPQIYPTDPALDVGGDGKVEWNLVEQKFNYTVTFGDPTLAAALEAGARNASTRFAMVPLKFISTTTGRVAVRGITSRHKAPPWCGQIPEYTLDEDSTATALIDLNLFFVDDETTNLTYEISYQEDSKKLRAELNPDGHSLDFKTPTRNWWGRAGFRVRAFDSDGLMFECPTFRVVVLPVNDPPQILAIGNQTARQGELFTLQVRARDVDMDLDPTETITFSDGTGLFDINPVTGLIEFTPAQEHVGVHEIPLTVTDRVGATGSLNFTLTVEDAEDPPSLDPIPDQTIVQGQLFSYQANAHDPDLAYGDTLIFSDDTPLFDIHPETGIMEWIPGKTDIGIHNINITVRDARGGQDRKHFLLTVLNPKGTLNRYPTLEPIPELTAHEGRPFIYTVAATDPDLEDGDVLTFSDNSPLFKIGPLNGTISFVPDRRSVGVHNITITVRDSEGLADTVTFRLTIVRANAPPRIISLSPKNGTKILVGKEVTLSATASDPDLDALNITWLHADRVLGYGPEVKLKFEETGGYIITVIVSDGRDEARSELGLEVVKSLPGKGGGGLPGFEMLMALVLLLITALHVATRRRPTE
ncbi:MAG: Ig-like domain-containing protein [Thermoplasmata archaeon]